MNNQCDLIKNKTQLDWATQLSGNPIGYDGDNAQLAYTCNPLGTSPLVSCPNNGEFKSIPGDDCFTYMNGEIGMEITNNTSISVQASSNPVYANTNFTFKPTAKINPTGQPTGCGCPNCELNWPIRLSKTFNTSGNLDISTSPLSITGGFDIKAGIDAQSGYFPYPGTATKCARIAYNAPKLGCCLNKKDVVQTYNGIPYTCDTNAISKYSLDCGATIADYCSTPDFFTFNGSPQNGSNGGISYDNRNFKEWLVGGKCFNYFNASTTKGQMGSNNLDALSLVLDKSIPAINKVYPVNNPGGDEVLSFDNGFFQINYDKPGGIDGMRVNLNGSYELNALIATIQNQINTYLGSDSITFGVTGSQFYMTPNQSGKVMQIMWFLPYSDPKTATILGGQNATAFFSQGETYILPNPFIGVSMGKQIWDNVAYAVSVAKSGTNSLKEVCKNFTRKDIETSYSSTYPNEKILAKMCACNLSSNQYSNFGGKIPPSDYAVCDPLCLASGTVGRYKDFAPEVCNNTNCIIDNTTINFVNSTSGDISFNQVCSSGNGANCYFSDNEVFNTASKIGKVKINQNCGRCFVYNPSSPFDPTEVDCLTGELPVENKIWNYIKEHKWLIVGISIGIVLVIILLIILRNISSKELQTQSLISSLKS
ncbi:MAG: hypothetical protein JST07_11270 [Bacteroidetes bacterium]|nr:hypothetical protein [Bacteroidota bacterium]